MAKGKPYMGAFENMEFPPYEFREYPKYLGTQGKVAVIAQNKEEEAELLAQMKLDEQTKANDASEKELLRAQVDELKKQLEVAKKPPVK